MKIVWLPIALQNLKDIRAYISKENSYSAGKVAKTIKETIAFLQDNPYLGAPSFVDGFREIQVAKYPFTIPYKVVGDKIIIVRVFHNKQKPTYWHI